MRGAETPNGWQWKRRHCYLAIVDGCDFVFQGVGFYSRVLSIFFFSSSSFLFINLF